MIDALEAGVAGVVRRDGVEIDVPDAAQLARRIDEIKEAAAEPAHRRDFQFAGADRLPEGHVAQPLGAVEGRWRRRPP